MSPHRSTQPTRHLGASLGTRFTSMTLGKARWVQALKEERRPRRRKQTERAGVHSDRSGCPEAAGPEKLGHCSVDSIRRGLRWSRILIMTKRKTNLSCIRRGGPSVP